MGKTKNITDQEALFQCEACLVAALRHIQSAKLSEKDQDTREASDQVLHAQGEAVTALSWMTKLMGSL